MTQLPKLAAIDLDDTLLGPDKRISPDNRAALRQLEASGVEILVATGRHLSRIRDILPLIPRARWAVTCQGAAVHELRGGRAIRAHHLEAAEIEQLLDAGERHGLTSVVYGDDLVRSNGGGEFVDFYGHYAGGMPQASNREELAKLPAHKLVWLGSEEALTRVSGLPEVRGIPLYQIRTHACLHEFLPVAATKALGVATVTSELGIRPDQVVAFGDGDNDIPLFEWAGRSFAMPHGSPGARAAALETAPDGPPESAFARAVASLPLPTCPSPS